jgi:hypothetical protein
MTAEVRHHLGEPDIQCPKTYCDVCQQQITDAREGNFHWRIDGIAADPVDGQIYHVHKRCWRRLEASMPGQWLWEELSRLPIQVGANLQVDFDRERARMREE